MPAASFETAVNEHVKTWRFEAGIDNLQEEENISTRDRSATSRSAVIDRSTMFSSDIRVCSSTIEAILMTLPSMVESNWKSIAHTTFGASASIGGIDDTPARLRGETTLTFRTSSRHRRWIHVLVFVDATRHAGSTQAQTPGTFLKKSVSAGRSQPGPRQARSRIRTQAARDAEGPNTQTLRIQ
jgi:hypothetical protein